MGAGTRELLRADGSAVRVAFAARRPNVEGQQLAVFAVLEDVTERRRRLNQVNDHRDTRDHRENGNPIGEHVRQDRRRQRSTEP
jgi:hypothetical protein